MIPKPSLTEQPSAPPAAGMHGPRTGTPGSAVPSSVQTPAAPPHPEESRPLEGQSAIARLSSEGFLGKIAAFLARKAQWSASRPGFFEPFHTDNLRDMRKEGKRVFPLRPLMAWDEEETAEPPRALKNDWRDLWMGTLAGKIVTSLPSEVLAKFPAITPQPGDVYALALAPDGRVIGVVELYAHNGVWRDRGWQSEDTQADRALLAVVLRFARDGKHAIALKDAPLPLAVERGAFWAWEWAVVPKTGGLWAVLAGWIFALRARQLSRNAHKQSARLTPA